MIRRRLINRLGTASHVADSIAAGNLSINVDSTGTDETGRLLASMSKMQQQLQKVLHGQQEMKRRHDQGRAELPPGRDSVFLATSPPSCAATMTWPLRTWQ